MVSIILQRRQGIEMLLYIPALLALSALFGFPG
jgi:hypothetical protein